MATFDMKGLSNRDRIVVGAGLIGLISLFLPWYGFSADVLGSSYSASVSGFSTGYGWIGGLLIVAAGVYLLLQRSGVDLTKAPAGPAVVVLGAAALGTLLVVLRWLTVPRASYGSAGGSASYGPRIGMILEIIVGIAQVIVAFTLFRSSGEKLPWQSQS